MDKCCAASQYPHNDEIKCHFYFMWKSDNEIIIRIICVVKSQMEKNILYNRHERRNDVRDKFHLHFLFN